MPKNEITQNGEKVFLCLDPQEEEIITKTGGIILVDTCGKRDVFSLAGKGRKERARCKRPRIVRGWANRFAREAKGRIIVSTFRREGEVVTIYPASEGLKQRLLDT